jgi:hypothetical protein
MKASSLRAKPMARERFRTSMEVSTRANGKMTSSMASAKRYGITEMRRTRASSLRARRTGAAVSFGKTDLFMRGILSTASSKAGALTTSKNQRRLTRETFSRAESKARAKPAGQMAESMQATSSMAKKTVTVVSAMRTATFTLESSKKVK